MSHVYMIMPIDGNVKLTCSSDLGASPAPRGSSPAGKEELGGDCLR